MARLQEQDRYEDVIKSIEFPCRELGDSVPKVFISGGDFTPGEDDFLEMYSSVSMDHLNYEEQLRKDEEDEERLINSVIQEEIANNFHNHVAWAHRDGTMGARHMQAQFEARLQSTGAEIQELCKRRLELRLNTRDMVE